MVEMCANLNIGGERGRCLIPHCLHCVTQGRHAALGSPSTHTYLSVCFYESGCVHGRRMGSRGARSESRVRAGKR